MLKTKIRVIFGRKNPKCFLTMSFSFFLILIFYIIVYIVKSAFIIIAKWLRKHLDGDCVILTLCLVQNILFKWKRAAYDTALML